MKWVGISGSWRRMNPQLEKEVRDQVSQIILRGDGIVTGGALAVDHIATEEALNCDQKAEKIKIFLPTTLEIYSQHYKQRAEEGLITKEQAQNLIKLLEKIKATNRNAIAENKLNQVVNEDTYHARNTQVVNASDELIAFQVNQSAGVQDTIDKAEEKGIPVKIFTYTII